MHLPRISLSIAVAAGMAVLPPAPASAQYYNPPCSPFPLFWPFCAAGAIVYGAATFAAAPFRAITGGPYYYGYDGQPPSYYVPPAYYGPGYTYPPANYPPR